MRYTVTPDLAQKVASTPSVVPAIAEFFRLLDENNREEIISNKSVSELVPAVLYTFQNTETRIFFSFASDDQGEFVLVADVISQDSHISTKSTPVANKDPIRNVSINPLKNPSIDPRYNSSLNPRYNSSINPKFNSAINPKYNSSINPRYNSSLNLKYNSSINPQYNYSLDPKRNWSINPSRNRLFSGIYLYDLNAKRTGFALKGNESLLLLFDMSANVSGTAVATSKGFVTFDVSSNFTGHWVRHERDGYLIFDSSNRWSGFVVL